MSDMRISVGFLTHGDNPWLAAAVFSVLNQSVKPYEVIVIDRGEGGYIETELMEVAEVAKRLGIQFIYRTGTPGPTSYGRKETYKCAGGDAVLFADDDQLYHFDFIKEAVRAFKQDGGRATVVIGRPVQIHDMGKFSSVKAPFSELTKGYADLKAPKDVCFDGLAPLSPKSIIEYTWTYGGTILLRNIWKPEDFFDDYINEAWDVGEDPVMVLKALFLSFGNRPHPGPKTKMGCYGLMNKRMVAFHLRRRPSLYAGGQVIIENAARKWGFIKTGQTQWTEGT